MRNEFLRHMLSTIAYRFQKSVSNLGTDFGHFRAGDKSRSPIEIINHIFYVLSATRNFMHSENYSSIHPKKLDLTSEINRFVDELKLLDKVLSSQEIEINYTLRLIQGPFSDVLTHIGQLSMLSGLYGYPILGEDFSSATIKTGII